jgi:2-phospho-L-lactate guanylyltransferase (CobY/MobA/RfbA family)
MGEAKRRGTLEERKQQAVVKRNLAEERAWARKQEKSIVVVPNNIDIIRRELERIRIRDIIRRECNRVFIITDNKGGGTK